MKFSQPWYRRWREMGKSTSVALQQSSPTADQLSGSYLNVTFGCTNSSSCSSPSSTTPSTASIPLLPTNGSSSEGCTPEIEGETFSRISNPKIELGIFWSLPSRLRSKSFVLFLWTGAGADGMIPCFRAPMLRDFRGGAAVPAPTPTVPPMTPAAACPPPDDETSPLVNWDRLGQANCKRYSVLIREIALLSWLVGSTGAAVAA